MSVSPVGPTAAEFEAALEPWPAGLVYAGHPQAVAGQVMADVERAEAATGAALAGVVELLTMVGADEVEKRAAVDAIAARLHAALRRAYLDALVGCDQ